MLEEFLALNPWSTVESTDDAVEIVNPWDDPSFRISVPAAAAEALSHLLAPVVLLPRFTGIHHRDRQEIEFIYTSLRPGDPVQQKTFVFRWRGVDHECRYDRASERVMTLARHFNPSGGETATEYRGLQRLALFRDLEGINVPERVLKFIEAMVPTSFYVNNVTSTDDAFLIPLTKHLNFYMSYFWRESPSILIHDKTDTATPYLPGVSSVVNIPQVISASDVDAFLLDLSLAARGGSNRLRFLYYYQILEYAAFYWTEESVKAGLRRVLMNPDLHARLDEYIPKLIETLVPTRQNDEHKIRRVIETAVDPASLWAEISANIACFAARTEFEGGFVMDALVSKDTTESSFGSMWSPKILEAFRAIRNALVHARESRTQAVIAPSQANEERLRPWVPIIRRVADRVMLFQAQTEA